jgi:protein-tyrosine phosphatase
MAAAIFKHKLVEKGLTDYFSVDSCGTSNYHIGGSADPRTIVAAKSKGVAMDHCVRQLVAADLDTYDYLIAMDRGNLQNILRLASTPHQLEKVVLMRAYDLLGKDEEVPDPYYGEQKHFEDVYEILDRSIDNFIEHIGNTVTIRRD